MSAIGIDLGGTKIEAQVFDAKWNVIARHRVPTPQSYVDLVAAIADQVVWADAQSDMGLPIGIGAAGLINPQTGRALTANLSASGQPFPRDIAAKVGRHITYVNDCRALALSEAVFGAGRGHATVMSLILGTGIGGGVVRGDRITLGPTHVGGEFGHTSAPAHLVAEFGLPLITCGCGYVGCIETYIAGPGLTRLALHMTGHDLTPPQIAARKGGDMAAVWGAWCKLTADLLRNLTLTVDPDVIVLGGGLSQIEGVADDLQKALQAAQFDSFPIPQIVLAAGGDASGARGAAYAAWQERQTDG